MKKASNYSAKIFFTLGLLMAFIGFFIGIEGRPLISNYAYAYTYTNPVSHLLQELLHSGTFYLMLPSLIPFLISFYFYRKEKIEK